MQTQKVVITLMAVINLSLASCSASKLLADTSTNTLKNTSWSLLSLPSVSLVADSLITINFDNDKVNGTDGCNRYNTSYTLNDGKLSIKKNVAVTMMACPEPIMQQASSYIGALTQATAYKMDGSQLTLVDTEGKTLAIFKKQSVELSGTSWLVTNINNGKQAVTSLINGSKLTIQFSTDGKLIGLAGCNNYMTSYEIVGRNITIKPAASTRKMCGEPAGIMEQEDQFLKALTTVATYRFDGKRLELRTADDALAVVLVSP